MASEEGIIRDKCPHCKRSLFGLEYFYVIVHENGYMRLAKTLHSANKALSQGHQVKIVKFEDLKDHVKAECFLTKPF